MAEGDRDKPNPIDDLRQGLGLLFRAAKTTLEKLPTGDIEEAVVTGAKEVGRAIENVTQAVEEQLLGKHAKPRDTAPTEGAGSEPAKTEEEKKEAPKDGEPPSDEPKTRVG